MLPFTSFCIAFDFATGLLEFFIYGSVMLKSLYFFFPVPFGGILCVLKAIFVLIISACLPNCQNCSAPGVCSACNAGYYVALNNSCSRKTIPCIVFNLEFLGLICNIFIRDWKIPAGDMRYGTVSKNCVRNISQRFSTCIKIARVRKGNWFYEDLNSCVREVYKK